MWQGRFRQVGMSPVEVSYGLSGETQLLLESDVVSRVAWIRPSCLLQARMVWYFKFKAMVFSFLPIPNIKKLTILAVFRSETKDFSFHTAWLHPEAVQSAFCLPFFIPSYHNLTSGYPFFYFPSSFISEINKKSPGLNDLGPQFNTCVSLYATNLVGLKIVYVALFNLYQGGKSSFKLGFNLLRQAGNIESVSEDNYLKVPQGRFNNFWVPVAPQDLWNGKNNKQICDGLSRDLNIFNEHSESLIRCSVLSMGYSRISQRTSMDELIVHCKGSVNMSKDQSSVIIGSLPRFYYMRLQGPWYVIITTPKREAICADFHAVTSALACFCGCNNRFITELHYCKKRETCNHFLPFWGGDGDLAGGTPSYGIVSLVFDPQYKLEIIKFKAETDQNITALVEKFTSQTPFNLCLELINQKLTGKKNDGDDAQFWICLAAKKIKKKKNLFCHLSHWFGLPRTQPKEHPSPNQLSIELGLGLYNVQ
ncbi:hypothetical protein VP01_3580g1 [Puccinia sorghi]|uniref:Uncharacterized protein n=1 Tax=Puccinia sorghi TaxID=27349 RepID=A0A0L6UV70_9BASI|nr:hypothetical protein VP01_3580g1 [Puccinia sorghi]